MTNLRPLVGKSVVLAPLRPADSSLLFQWINDRELVTLSAPFRPVSRQDHDAWFDEVQRRPDTRILGIRLRDGDRLVGSSQLHSIHPVHRSAELQIRIGVSEARGHGVGTEAMHLLVRFGFEELDLHRIYLHVFEANEPAIRLYRRVGFRAEGVLRQAARIEDEWVDLVVMAILRSEFEAL
jgi:RimJ/RimL family protein N-acetyltransferase